MKRLLTKKQYQSLSRNLALENKKQPARLIEIDPAHWSETNTLQKPALQDAKRFKVWRSNKFLVQAFNEQSAIRLSINRTQILPSGDWIDGIDWETIQDIKSQCGYGDKTAIEIFPPDAYVVHDANMRHLWILDRELEVGWRPVTTVEGM